MASALVTGAAFVAIVVILASVLETVERREKFSFVAGVALIIVGPGLVTLVALPEIVGGGIAFIGLVMVVASTGPLLFESRPTT